MQEEFLQTLEPETSGRPGTRVFLHIPKTGGSTLRKIIERQYGPTETLRCYYQKQGVSLKAAVKDIRSAHGARDNIRIVVGHLGFGIHKYLPWQCSYFTIVRDPVARVISSYYHIRRDNLHPLHRSMQKMTLHDFVSARWFDPATVPSNAVNALDNTQTRLLSGSVVHAELSDGPLEYGACDRKLLGQAKDNLTRFITVGLCERFDETVMLLKQILGWSTIYYVKSNVGWNKDRHHEISRQTLSAIEDKNEFDIELYGFAQARFAEAVSRQGLLFRTMTDSYRLINRTYGEARRVSWAIEKRLLRKTAKTVSR